MPKKKILAEDYPHILRADRHGCYALLQDYLEALRIKNYSTETVIVRERLLLPLIEWCGVRGVHRPGAVTKPILERYQKYLYHYRKANGAPLSFASQTNHLSAIKGWFKWLARQNLITSNPASELELPKIPKRLPRVVLTANEAERVLSQCDVTNAFGVRDRAIIELLYSCGLRRIELTRLNCADIDRERKIVLVREGKGKKDRFVPIGERALLWLEKYLFEARPELSCGIDDGALFLNQYGALLAPNGLTELVREYVQKARLSKTGACHLFRHTMATLMLENGADIRYIQAMLGHASLESTEVYTQVSLKQLQQVHAQTHPARVMRTKQIDWHDEPPATVDDLLESFDAESEEE